MIVEGGIQSSLQICSVYLTSSKPLHAHSIGLRRLNKRELSCILIQTMLCNQHHFKCTISLDSGTNTPTIMLQTEPCSYQALCAFVECFHGKPHPNEHVLQIVDTIECHCQRYVKHEVFAEKNLLLSCH